MKRTKAEIKISVVRTEITINILSTTADNHYSYCRQQEPMGGDGEGGRGKRERGEKEGGEGEGRDKEREGERRRGMGRKRKLVSWCLASLFKYDLKIVHIPVLTHIHFLKVIHDDKMCIALI